MGGGGTLREKVNPTRVFMVDEGTRQGGTVNLGKERQACGPPQNGEKGGKETLSVWGKEGFPERKVRGKYADEGTPLRKRKTQEGGWGEMHGAWSR